MNWLHRITSRIGALLGARTAPTAPQAELDNIGQGQPPAQEDLIQPLPSDYPHEETVLPDAVMEQIDALIAAVKHKRSDETGDVVALFAGASGIGKTMAAMVIARQTGRDLYRVNLAGVVSKYIGETEKNLDRIFSAADSRDAILLFDEADALFGKRTEIKDAHDRYANVETAYLLQRIESHTGIVILTSNCIDDIEPAFRRRMKWIVAFPCPDAAMREQ